MFYRIYLPRFIKDKDYTRVETLSKSSSEDYDENYTKITTKDKQNTLEWLVNLHAFGLDYILHTYRGIQLQSFTHDKMETTSDENAQIEPILKDFYRHHIIEQTVGNL